MAPRSHIRTYVQRLLLYQTLTATVLGNKYRCLYVLNRHFVKLFFQASLCFFKELIGSMFDIDDFISGEAST